VTKETIKGLVTGFIGGVVGVGADRVLSRHQSPAPPFAPTEPVAPTEPDYSPAPPYVQPREPSSNPRLEGATIPDPPSSIQGMGEALRSPKGFSDLGERYHGLGDDPGGRDVSKIEKDPRRPRCRAYTGT
jgi:hypothetical protein